MTEILFGENWRTSGVATTTKREAGLCRLILENGSLEPGYYNGVSLYVFLLFIFFAGLHPQKPIPKTDPPGPTHKSTAVQLSGVSQKEWPRNFRIFSSLVVSLVFLGDGMGLLLHPHLDKRK